MSSGFGRKGLEPGRPSLSEAPKALSSVARFDITPHALKMLVIIGFGIAVGLYALVKLLHPGGLLINGIIELGPLGADIFFGAILLGGLALAAVGLLGFFRSFGEKLWLTLDNAAITGPRRFGTKAMVRIAYSDIAEIKRRRYQNQEFLTLKARDGRTIKVGTGNFRVQEEWPEFIAELQRRGSKQQ